MVVAAAAAMVADGGVRTLSQAEMSARPRSGGLKANAEWSATLTRVNGQVLQLTNLGDRFASVDLARNEQCRVCLTVPGLNRDAVATFASTHGGKVDGESRGKVRATDTGQFCFDYQMGTMGAHPLVVTVRGRSMTLLFTVEAPSLGTD